jgi:hypothetical protein
MDCQLKVRGRQRPWATYYEYLVTATLAPSKPQWGRGSSELIAILPGKFPGVSAVSPIQIPFWTLAMLCEGSKAGSK